MSGIDDLLKDPQFARDFALVSWRAKQVHGRWVFARQGTGDTGWWHLHGKEKVAKCGGHPVDGDKCRDCDALMSLGRKRTKPKIRKVTEKDFKS